MPAIWIPKRLVEISLINAASTDKGSFIRHCEFEYESRVYAAAKEIVAADRHVVMLTGPSGSGKTTTSNKIAEKLRTMGKKAQVLSMDDTGTTRARVRDQISRQYDYTDAIEDMKSASEIVEGLPYIYYNLGNLYCLSSEHVNSIDSYTKAIELYPYMGDAYFNRGLVLIYLKDMEKGCIDLSRAGELGVQDAYGVIKKYCEKDNE